MQPLGESWDVVEVVRSLAQAVGSLTTEVDSLQERIRRESRGAVASVGKGSSRCFEVGDLVAEARRSRGARWRERLRRSAASQVGVRGKGVGSALPLFLDGYLTGGRYGEEANQRVGEHLDPGR